MNLHERNIIKNQIVNLWKVTTRDAFVDYANFLEESFRLLTLAIVKAAFENRLPATEYPRLMGTPNFKLNVKIKPNEYDKQREDGMLQHVAYAIISEGHRIRSMWVFHEETPDGLSFTFELFTELRCAVVPQELRSKLETPEVDTDGWKRF